MWLGYLRSSVTLGDQTSHDCQGSKFVEIFQGVQGVDFPMVFFNPVFFQVAELLMFAVCSLEWWENPHFFVFLSSFPPMILGF